MSQEGHLGPDFLQGFLKGRLILLPDPAEDCPVLVPVTDHFILILHRDLPLIEQGIRNIAVIYIQIEIHIVQEKTAAQAQISSA